MLAQLFELNFRKPLLNCEQIPKKSRHGNWYYVKDGECRFLNLRMKTHPDKSIYEYLVDCDGSYLFYSFHQEDSDSRRSGDGLLEVSVSLLTNENVSVSFSNGHLIFSDHDSGLVLADAMFVIEHSCDNSGDKTEYGDYHYKRLSVTTGYLDDLELIRNYDADLVEIYGEYERGRIEGKRDVYFRRTRHFVINRTLELGKKG